MEQKERAFVDLVEGLRRKPKMHCIIRSKTDLLDSFDDTLRENLDRRGKNDKSAGIDQEGPRVI